MEAGTRARGVRRRLAAAVVALGTATPAVAQSPEPAPFPLPVPAPPPPPIEVYYGTTKVSPAAAVVTLAVTPTTESPQAIIPAVAKGGPNHAEQVHPGEALVETLHAVRDGTRTVSAAAATLLGKVGDRLMTPAAEPRQIVVSHAPPPPIVVVREPAAESRPTPAPEPARGLTFSVESVVALGVAVVGVLFGLVALARGSRKADPPVVAPPAVPVPVPAPEPPPASDGVRLMGKYDAGSLPESAEKFDLGPTYQDEQRQKRHAEEANNQAAVEFILNQNLALLAALNTGASAGGPPPEADCDGFTIPVDPPAAPAAA